MTEEEYFRENYSDSCYGDKPLSPHWDFFQDGVEFGERQSEKRIEELEEISTRLESYYQNQKVRIADLEKENAELKEELKKWKDEWQEQVQKATDEGYARTLQTMQLTKAKELLKLWLSLCGFKVEKLAKDTEQFLKEINE